MKILLAIDGFDESMHAASLLARLPFREKPTVLVLRVLEDNEVSDLPGYWANFDEKEAPAQLEGVKSVLLDASDDLSCVIKRGYTSQTILDAAKEMGADLIVMGARGHSAIYRVLLGSTATYVAHHAQCSVLVVRPPLVEAEAPAEFSVMLAYDGSTYSGAASQQLFDLDWPKDSASIHIAMMLPRPKLVPEEIDYDSKAIADANRTLPTLADNSSCHCAVTHSVRESYHIGSSLLDLAESKSTNLLFVGAAGKSAISRFFLGSTSRYLLNHANCSIWIARSKDWV